MIVYGLFVKGESACGWSHKSYSKKLFYTKDEALKYKDKFIEKCCDFELLDFLIKGTEKVSVVEYEIEEGLFKNQTI